MTDCIESSKYNCEQCNYGCNNVSLWKKHINTEKHKTGKIKKRSDYGGPYICDKCEYETINKFTFLQHKLNEHANKEERENGFKYYCKLCDIGTFGKNLYERHTLSQRHKKHEANYK
jgi:hypothetical protein